MNIQDLFVHQQDVTEKLKTVLRDRGYTKVPFSKQPGITRPALDTILNWECSSTTKYNSSNKPIFCSMAMFQAPYKAILIALHALEQFSF